LALTRGRPGGFRYRFLVRSRREKRAAKRETIPGSEHRQQKDFINRAKNSYQPTERRARTMKQ
jgi:hypothetical protein